MIIFSLNSKGSQRSLLKHPNMIRLMKVTDKELFRKAKKTKNGKAAQLHPHHECDGNAENGQEDDKFAIIIIINTFFIIIIIIIEEPRRG